jgi:hypothetical protein
MIWLCTGVQTRNNSLGSDLISCIISFGAISTGVGLSNVIGPLY